MADAPLPELAANYGDFTRLGRGALGETWRARETRTNDDVVLKIRPISEAATRYFERELELMRLLTNPRLQRMRGHIQTPSHLVMIYSFVPGRPLYTVIRDDGPLPEEHALQITLQLMDALHTIHQAGFIYRDLSPQNIIMRGPVDPVLIDFNAIGQLTETSARGDRTTMIGEISGKPLYMSPEQIAAAPQSPASDIWNLGAVLYEMLTGFSYRMAGSIRDIIASATDPTPPDLSEVPAAYRDILGRMLTTDPQSRPTLKDARREISKLHGAAIGDAVASGIDLDDFGELLKIDLSAPKRETGYFGDDWSSDPPAAPAAVQPVPMDAPAAPAPADPFAPPPEPLSKSAKSSWVPGPIVLGLYTLFMAGVGTVLVYPELLSFQGGFSPTERNALLLIAFAIVIVGIGHLLSRRVHTRAEVIRETLPFQAVDLISAENPREQLSRTICIEIDAYRAAAAGAGDDILTITMVAAAQEYRDATSPDDRIKALQMLADLNAKVSARLKPWWLDYEKLVARGISLTSFLAGGVALYQAILALSG